MITLEVHLNGKRLCRAGVGAHGVVSAITMWVNRAVRTATGDIVPGKFEEFSELSVGGLGSTSGGADVLVKWAQPRLKVGDEIRIRVVDGARPTKPRTRKRVDPKLEDKAKRREYERLKREYGDTEKPTSSARGKARKPTG